MNSSSSHSDGKNDSDRVLKKEEQEEMYNDILLDYYEYQQNVYINYKLKKSLENIEQQAMVRRTCI